MSTKTKDQALARQAAHFEQIGADPRVPNHTASVFLQEALRLKALRAACIGRKADAHRKQTSAP